MERGLSCRGLFCGRREMNGRLDAPSRRRSIRRGLDTHTRARRCFSPLRPFFSPDGEGDSTPQRAHWWKFNRCHRSRVREFRCVRQIPFRLTESQTAEATHQFRCRLFWKKCFFFSSTRVVGYRAWTCQVDGFIHGMSRRRSIPLHRFRTGCCSPLWRHSTCRRDFLLREKGFCGLSNHSS